MLDLQWQELARTIAGPYCNELAKALTAARLLGAREDQLDEVRHTLFAKIREMLTPIFTPEMIELIEAELMYSYRKQLEPLSTAGAVTDR
jgi:hypothetical protein